MAYFEKISVCINNNAAPCNYPFFIDGHLIIIGFINNETIHASGRIFTIGGPIKSKLSAIKGVSKVVCTTESTSAKKQLKVDTTLFVEELLNCLLATKKNTPQLITARAKKKRQELLDKFTEETKVPIHSLRWMQQKVASMVDEIISFINETEKDLQKIQKASA